MDFAPRAEPWSEPEADSLFGPGSGSVQHGAGARASGSPRLRAPLLLRILSRHGWTVSSVVAAGLSLALPSSAADPPSVGPGAAPSTDAVGLGRDGSATGAADTSTPVEVTVRGRSAARPYGEFRSDDLRRVPGTFGDPFQALASMPGIAAMASGIPYFFVRGAPPANTGFFVDGIPVPLLFHIGPGPSVVPTGLLDQVGFYPGPAPARFGRYAGGIVAGETRAPQDRLHAEASARLFDASALVEGPLDSRTAAVAAGRFGYPNVLLSLVAPSLSLEYWDYMVRVSRALSIDDALSVTAFGALDRMHDNVDNIAPIDTQFHRLDLRYDRRWSDGSFRIGTTIGIDRTEQQTDLSTSRRDAASNQSTRVRFHVRQQIVRALAIEVGGDALLGRYTTQRSDGTALGLDPPVLDAAGGLFLELPMTPFDGLELVAGLRADAYRSGEETASSVDPRVRARVRVIPEMHWFASYGTSHQVPTYLVTIPGLRIALQQGLQATHQISTGMDFALPGSIQATVTGFFFTHQNTDDYLGGCGTMESDCHVVQAVEGRTYGVELLVQRSLSRNLSGWLSYSLSRAERTYEGATFLSPFDRTHAFSAVLSYRFPKGYRAGLRGTYYTGRPDVPSFVFAGQSTSFFFRPGEFPQHRLPDFYRIDVRAEKRWSLGDQGWVALVIDMFNATLKREALEYRCSFDGLCSAREIGPIALPSIGLEAGY